METWLMIGLTAAICYAAGRLHERKCWWAAVRGQLQRSARDLGRFKQ